MGEVRKWEKGWNVVQGTLAITICLFREVKLFISKLTVYREVTRDAIGCRISMKYYL